jgi:hypothetical protein
LHSHSPSRLEGTRRAPAAAFCLLVTVVQLKFAHWVRAKMQTNKITNNQPQSDWKDGKCLCALVNAVVGEATRSSHFGYEPHPPLPAFHAQPNVRFIGWRAPFFRMHAIAPDARRIGYGTWCMDTARDLSTWKLTVLIRVWTCGATFTGARPWPGQC